MATNADRIRSMSDEELAMSLTTGLLSFPTLSTPDQMLKWLKQEV